MMRSDTERGRKHRRELTWALVWLAVLVALTATMRPFRGQLEPGTVALVLLLAPLSATLASLRVALVASALSALTFNFFFTQPYDSLRIESSTSVAAFAVYLVIALTVSLMADRLRRHTDESERRAAHATLLRDLTIDLVRQRVWLQPPVSSALADLVRFLGLRGAAMRVDVPDVEQFEIDAGASERSTSAVGSLMRSMESMEPNEDLTVLSLRRADHLYAFPVATATSVYGMLAVEPLAGELEPEDERIVSLFANVVALACERATYVQHAVEAKAIEETDRLRVQMMRAVTHDLRTPLTSVRALAAALGDQGSLNEAQRESIDDIEREAVRLTLLVNRVLDLSRIESGSLQLHTHTVGVDDLVRSAVDLVRRQAEFELDLPADLPAIPVDETLMQQALLNLLENAVRHGKPPFELSVRVRDKRLEIRIIDHGKGIPESERRRIFDPTYAMRQHTPEDRSRGLGLAVSSGFVQAHHGYIRVEPTAGGGATFVVSLPVDAVVA